METISPKKLGQAFMSSRNKRTGPGLRTLGRHPPAGARGGYGSLEPFYTEAEGCATLEDIGYYRIRIGSGIAPRLYSVTAGQWRSHPPVLRCNRLPKYAQEGTLCSAPSSPRRATVYNKGTSVICTGSNKILYPVVSRALTFREHLHSVSHLSWCIYFLDLQNDGRDLADALLSGILATIMAVSDGSYKDHFGTAAWTIGAS